MVEFGTPPAVEGVETAIWARSADECNLAMGQKLSAEEDKTHAAIIREAQAEELDACARVEVIQSSHAP